MRVPLSHDRVSSNFDVITLSDYNDDYYRMKGDSSIDVLARKDDLGEPGILVPPYVDIPW